MSEIAELALFSVLFIALLTGVYFFVLWGANDDDAGNDWFMF